MKKQRDESCDQPIAEIEEESRERAEDAEDRGHERDVSPWVGDGDHRDLFQVDRLVLLEPLHDACEMSESHDDDDATPRGLKNASSEIIVAF